jgi:hypothetical protein
MLSSSWLLEKKIIQAKNALRGDTRKAEIGTLKTRESRFAPGQHLRLELVRFEQKNRLIFIYRLGDGRFHGPVEETWGNRFDYSQRIIKCQ